MSEFPNLNKISHLIVTFFGVGLLPMAPGTWGSIAIEPQVPGAMGNNPTPKNVTIK